jgi:hypothetical protein
MTLERFFGLIRVDARRPWSLWTTVFLIASFVQVAIEKLCCYGRAPVLEGSALRVYVWGAFLLLAFFGGAVLSLLRPGVARAVPALLLLLLIGLGWLEVVTALMWLPFVAVEFVHRLVSG